MTAEITEIRGSISPQGPHQPEAGRYVLYTALGCPFAIRPTLIRELKGLQEAIELCILDYHYVEVGKGEEGEPEWGLCFSSSDKVAHCTPDPVMNAAFIKDIYQKYCPQYKGRYTVPLLFDKKLSVLVNNDSADLMRIMNSAFNNVAKNSQLDLFPLNKETVMTNTLNWSIQTICFVPLHAGTAATQEEYERHATYFAQELVRINEQLGKTKYYLGDELTAADTSLLNVIIRHDVCNVILHRVNNIYVRDLANVMRWIKTMLDMPGIRQLTSIEHIKGMTFSKRAYNPSGIIPLGDGFVLP